MANREAVPIGASRVMTESSTAIVLLNWNQRDDTVRCLESLRRAELGRASIVVVDNGSADGSVDVVRERFPEVHVVDLDVNRGCSGGRNAGLEWATARDFTYVLFLDNDTEVMPDFLTPLVELMDGETEVAICGGVILHAEPPQTVWAAGGVIRGDGYTPSLHYGVDPAEVAREPFPVDWVPGCLLMVRAAVTDRIGRFDDDYFIYFEDIDFCVAAREAGYRVVIEPRSRVLHHVSRSLGGADSPARAYYMTRNHLLFLRKHGSRGAFMVSLLRYVARLVRRVILRRPGAGATIRGARDFFTASFGERS